MCGADSYLKLHRDGQLCGGCEVGYAPPAYSYSLACVECSDYAKNWVMYIAVAFLPLTLLFGVFIVLRISATSGLLNSFVFVTQIISMPVQMKVITAHAILGEHYTCLQHLCFLPMLCYHSMAFGILISSAWCTNHFVYTLK